MCHCRQGFDAAKQDTIVVRKNGPGLHSIVPVSLSLFNNGAYNASRLQPL